MFRTVLKTAAAAAALTTFAAAMHPPRANADIGDVLDVLEEFEDIREDYEDCAFTIRKMKVKVRTQQGMRWVWVKRRVRDCD